MAITIRPGAPADAGAVCAIYNEGIAGRTATFETRPRSVDDIADWFGAAALPVMVAEEAGDLLGFAVSHAYSQRACYAGIREFSVYVRPGHRRRGIARLLLVALMDANARTGGWKLIGRIFSSNLASLALCRELGFRVVGTHVRHARLDGEWRDVTLVERGLE